MWYRGPDLKLGLVNSAFVNAVDGRDAADVIERGSELIDGQGEDSAIATARATIGATNPANADPGSIRGSLALAMPDNLVHGSDSPESAEREIALWFPDGLV